MANPARGNRDPRRSLLIRSLRFDTPTSLVRREFERFGAIRDVYLPLDYRSRRPRGFGFVEYVEEEDARAALEKMDGAILDGVTISVTFAQEGRKSPESMRHREYESFHGSGGRHLSGHRYGPHHHYKSDPYRRYPSPRDYREGSRLYDGNRHPPYRSRSRSPPPSREYERYKDQYNYRRDEDFRREDYLRSHYIRGRSCSNGNVGGNYRSEVYERNYPQRDSARSYSRGRSRSRSGSRGRSRSRSMSELGSRNVSCSMNSNRSTSLNQSSCENPERGRNNHRKIEAPQNESKFFQKEFMNEHNKKNYDRSDSDRQVSTNWEQREFDKQANEESPIPSK
ncbi:RNA recognition motif domain protein family protein [Cryptosporidium meleagridis]|uniref:RNA recognition motif domain protein family protein n=1 Tax=Cryptosporidium meleagridis TaxID=93969 RepID=A0A2P4Z3K9_9CRYT|nr:RNA recognition motif domain protein family protein [Cryptosporidium meleagridis]